jgi:hypothetical protein
MKDDSRRAHKETLVKVNAFVDEGVAPLVLALNSIEGVITLDSCERDVVSGEASVYFQYGTGWQELGNLVEALARALRSLNLCCGFSASLEWFGSNDRPRAHLSVKPEHVADVAAAIRPGLLTAVGLR